MRTLLAGVMLGASTLSALAGSELLPGISTGLPLGVPLPEGLYVISIPSWGTRSGNGTDIDIFATAPAWMIWSTPWTIAGGRVLFDAVTPYADVSIRKGPHFSGFLNPIVGAQLKWDLGGGFFGGFHAGVYLPMKNELTTIGLAHDYASFQGIGTISYFKDGWNLTSTLVYGTGKSGLDGGPDWFNVDLTATKKFDKFEVGAVAFGSTDLSAPFAGYAKQSQFAVGGLVGYDFGAFNVQLKLTTDVSETNYGTKDTRAWANVTIPLWNPAPPTPKPVTAKF